MVTSQTGGNIEKHNNDNKDRLEVATKTLKVFALKLVGRRKGFQIGSNLSEVTMILDHRIRKRKSPPIFFANYKIRGFSQYLSSILLLLF